LQQNNFLLAKPIATPHIATTINESDIVAIGRNYHKYGPIAMIFHRGNRLFFSSSGCTVSTITKTTNHISMPISPN
jgi:hypothetical protein